MFNHPLFHEYANKYEVDSSGTEIFSFARVARLTIHINKVSKMRFVRISAANKKSMSIGVAKLILLTFFPREYKKGLIAIHLKGKQDKLSNLAWGTRTMQSKIQMSDMAHAKRVALMAKKFYHTKEFNAQVLRLFKNGNSISVISKRCGRSEQSVRVSLKRNGYECVYGVFLKV